MQKETILSQKCAVLQDLIRLTADLYHSPETTAHQKGLLETLIGAGIWYLPSTDPELFSGLISKAAKTAILENQGDVKLVEEHAFPRKVAGNYLYSKEVIEEIKTNPEFLKQNFKDRFGKYNLVLKEENNRLKKHQRKDDFIDENTAYQLAGIELVPFTMEEYKSFKRNKKQTSKN